MAPALTISNPIMDRMRAGDAALGMSVRLGRSGDIARIAKTTGHDFIFIDMQHSLFSVETVGHIAQVALGCGISPLARVLGVDDPMTPLLLDNGVTGIVFPDVGTADQARRAVDRAKFRRSASARSPAAIPNSTSGRSPSPTRSRRSTRRRWWCA